MIRWIFIGIVLIIVYFSYISPMFRSMRAVSKDGELHNLMVTIQEYERYDPRSYSKCIKHLKSFMMYYSDTYHEGSVSLQKMKSHKSKIVMYIQRMIHRLPNDAEFDYKMKDALEKMNIKLNTYINEASDRKGEYFFPTDY